MSFQHLFLPCAAHRSPSSFILVPHPSSVSIPNEAFALISTPASCPRIHGCADPAMLCRREVNGVQHRLLLLRHPRLPAPPVVYRRSCGKTHPPCDQQIPSRVSWKKSMRTVFFLWCFVGPSVTVAKQILISFMTFGYFTIHILYKIKLSVWWKELVWIFVIYWDCTSEILFSCLRSVSLFLLMDFAFCCFMFLLLFVHMNLGSLNISVMVLSYIICRIYSWIISHGIFYS
jgi:hypothetical protein